MCPLRHVGYNFYIFPGSIICGTCAQGMDSPMRLSLGLIRLYASLRKWDISKIDRIKMTGTLLAELSEVLNSHIQHTIAKPLKTRHFSPDERVTMGGGHAAAGAFVQPRSVCDPVRAFPHFVEYSLDIRRGIRI